MNYSGSTLNLGAECRPQPATLDVENTGSVLNMNGHGVNAASVLLGWFAGGQSVTVLNQGTIMATDFYLGNGMAYNFLDDRRGGQPPSERRHRHDGICKTGYVTASATVNGAYTQAWHRPQRKRLPGYPQRWYGQRP